MKKKLASISLICLLATGAFAKNIGLTFNVGAIFSHTRYHDWGTSISPYKERWSSSYGHIGGGFDISLRYTFYKQLAIYGMFDAAFPAQHEYNTYSTYLIDSQFGLGWTFNLAKKFNLFVGGGLGLGGTGWKSSPINTKKSIFNVGGAISAIFSYMFVPRVGIYFGVSENLYSPVKYTIKRESSETTGTPKDKFASSLNLKLGLQFAF